MPTVLELSETTLNRIQIVSPPWAKDVIRSVGGSRWWPQMHERGAWTIPATTTAAEALARAAKKNGYQLEGDAAWNHLLDEARAAHRARKSLADRDPTDPLGLPDIPGRTPAWAHQRQGYHFARHMDAAGLGMDMGCLDGDAIVHVSRGTSGLRMTIRELHERWCASWSRLETPTYVRGETSPGVLGKVQLLATQHTGWKATVIVVLDDGKTIRCTPDHELQTVTGKRRADELRPGSAVAIHLTGPRTDKDGYVRVRPVGVPTSGGIPRARLVTAAEDGQVTHHLDGDKANDDRPNLALLPSQSPHASLHAYERVRDDRGRFLPSSSPRARNLVGHRNRFRFGYAAVVEVREAGPSDVFDLTVDAESHTYVADGIVVSNTGKSKTAIGLLDGWDASLVIILCPKAVTGVWPHQFAEHSIRGWRVLPLKTGTTARRAAKLLTEFTLAKSQGTPLAVVINYEAAWRTAMADALTYVLDQSPGVTVAICDESHKIKAPGGRASRFAHNLGHHANRRLCLTGTPAPHSPLDLYAQCRFLDEAVFGTNYISFKTRYGDWGGFEGRKLEGIINEDELAAKIGRLWFQCKAEDVLDLPEIRDEAIPVEIGAQAQKAYDLMESEFYALLDDGIVTAANAGVKVLRLQQITSGYLPLDDPDEDGARIVSQLDTAKKDALADLADGLPRHPFNHPRAGRLVQPLVVFARFRHDLDNVHIVADALKLRYRELSGRRRDAIDEDSRLVEDVDLAGVQIQAGGAGIDLTRARYAVYYSIGYSLGDYLQSRKRLHRPGQSMGVVLYHLTAEGTVDETIYQALLDRQQIVKAVMDEARKHTPEGATHA